MTRFLRSWRWDSPDDPLTARRFASFRASRLEDGDLHSGAAVRFARVGHCNCGWSPSEEAGLPPIIPALIEAADWLLAKQISGPGDLMVKPRGVCRGMGVDFAMISFPMSTTPHSYDGIAAVDYPDKRAWKLPAARPWPGCWRCRMMMGLGARHT